MARLSSIFKPSPDYVREKLSTLHVLPRCVVLDLDDTVWQGDVDCTLGPPFRPYCSISTLSLKKEDVEKLITDKTFKTTFRSQEVDGILDRSCGESMKPSSKTLASDTYDTNCFVKPCLLLFPDVLAIFAWLESKSVHIAVASRTTEPQWAAAALRVLKTTGGKSLAEIISCSECYNSNKKVHLGALSRKLKIRMSEMVFFDNLQYNISDVQSMSLAVPTNPKVQKRESPICIHTPEGLNWTNFVEGLFQYQEARLGASCSIKP